MKLQLDRYSATPHSTLGVLTCEGEEQKIITMEARMPKTDGSYISHCLPPGTYPLQTELTLGRIQDMQMRIWWLAFMPVKWFPKAGFRAGNAFKHSGAIGIGTSTDGYVVEGCDDATVILTRWAKMAQDNQEPITLEIRNRPDMEIITETLDMRQEREAEEERQAKVDETMKWLYG